MSKVLGSMGQITLETTGPQSFGSLSLIRMKQVKLPSSDSNLVLSYLITTAQ